MASGTWRLFHGGRHIDVHVRPHGTTVPAEGGSPDWLGTLIWDGLHGRAPGLRDTLFEVAERLSGLPLQSGHMPEPGIEHEINDILRAALRDGRLVADAPPRTPVEQRPQRNDIIDPFDEPPPPPPPIPPVEQAWFEVQVVDEVGAPIDGLRMAFTIEGISQTITTDGNGVARLPDAEGTYATVEVLVLQELRDKVTPRWEQPREPAIPESTEQTPVHIERLDDHFDPVGLSRRKRAILVIVPRFACREVAATTFDFARSFVRRDGIPSLAAIAEELHQDDGQQALIFGHTDTSGSEELNKRLSERRAKAVFAVLTHDTEKWEDMWRARINERPWWERWGTREAQHMLNALQCPDDHGEPLGEDGDKGSRTNEAIRRFKRGEYPRKPAEQASLPDNSTANADFRRELFLAYAKLVTREPVDVARFVPLGGSPFMGCGEFNPLSLQARDELSRRTVVFVFDPAATPAGPPCAIGDIAPCQAVLDEPPTAEDEDGEPNPGPFYRCQYYQQLATCCRSAGGPDLAHDVIVRFFMPLSDANGLPHRFVLESEDQADEDDDDEPGFSQEQTLSADARTFVPEEEVAREDDDDTGDDDAGDDDTTDDSGDDDDAGDDDTTDDDTTDDSGDDD
ncbi:MAG: OmpA family protein, partial [Deltaproteobacteria bacterium]|nr:OmpA family protein [Deltaproteobacteria bacterium]